MARGRMIKPELWTSKRINKVSLESNLLFIALLNFCDDFGTIQDSNRMILGNCFPYRENITEKMIEKWKSELVEVQLLAKIEYQGRNLLAVVKWEKHQTIMNRSKRNNIDNCMKNQDVILTIETLISKSLGANYPIDNRQETIDNRQMTIADGEKSPCGFDEFWKAYARKEGRGDKPKAEKIWKKLNAQEKALALAYIPDYIVLVKETQYMKHAYGYLQGRLWEDRIEADPEEQLEFEVAK